MIVYETNRFELKQTRIAGGDLMGYTQRSPLKETVNEDGFAFFKLGSRAGILVVCDGVGGSPKGNVATRYVLQAFEKVFAQINKGTNFRNRILDAIELANREIIKKGKGALTTCVAAELTAKTCRVYHCGDSSAFVVGQDEVLKAYTVSHSPLGYAMELGLDRREVQHIRTIVNNVVGAKDLRIEVGPVLELHPSDKLILCTDGISDNFELSHLVYLLKRNDLEELQKSLVMETLRKFDESKYTSLGAPDDFTFLVWKQTNKK